MQTYFYTPPQVTILYGGMTCWCSFLPINTWVNHVTSGKAGWTPDCSLHPIQWNFSGKRDVALLWGPFRLKAYKLRELGQFKHFCSSLSGCPSDAHPMINASNVKLNSLAVVILNLIKSN